MKRARLVLALCAAVITGCGAPPPEEAAEERPAPVRAVRATAVRLSDWTSLLGATEVAPQRIGRVSAAVEGRVVSVLAEAAGQTLTEGQQVKAGQVIAQLDDRVVRAAREKTRLALDELAEQALQAGFAAGLARIDVERLTRLRATPGPLAGVALAAGPELAKAKLTLADAESKRRAVDLRGAGLRAEIAGLDVQAELHTLRTPIDGRLGPLLVAPGQALTVGTAVAEVVDLSELQVLCYAPPGQVSVLAVGQVASLSAPSAPAAARGAAPEAERGRVVCIAAQAHPDTGNVAVKLRFPNARLTWRAGLVARVDVQTREEASRLTVPVSCLIEDEEPPGVAILTGVTKVKVGGAEVEQGKVKRMRARVGIRDTERHRVEVLSLADPAGQLQVPVGRARFVSEGWQGLKDDDPVKIEPAEMESGAETGKETAPREGPE